MHQRRCWDNQNMDFDQPPEFENSNIGSCDVANDNPEMTIESLQMRTFCGCILVASNSNH